MATFNKIYEKTKEYLTVILHRHTSLGPDVIGPQAGLIGSLRLVSPDKETLCVGENDEGDLIWINKMDKVAPEDYRGALVIITGTANTPRISNKNYDRGDFLIKIDHHPGADSHADTSYADPDAPAASEVVFDSLKAENLSVTKEVAAALYAGTVGDTDRPMYPEASARIPDAAAELTKAGTNTADIVREIADVTFDEAKL